MKLASTIEYLPENVRKNFTGHEVATEASFESDHGYNRYTLRYHATDVIEVTEWKFPQGIVSAKLKTGGWHTATTRDRINKVLSELGMRCHVAMRNRRLKVFTPPRAIDLEDGIIIQKHPSGVVLAISPDGEIIKSWLDSKEVSVGHGAASAVV